MSTRTTITRYGAIILAAGALGGCNQPMSTPEKGALVGGALGTGIGLATGGSFGAVVGAGLIGGAVGNLYDRLANGYVTDFIHIAGWPVFNLADTFITLGVGILMLILLRSERAPVAAR